MEKIRNYGLLVKYLVSTQWKKLRGGKDTAQQNQG
ncbi:hypothetical protein SAMN05444580_103104 [Rhodococcus tukisamuensis]|uniref:Uncharacterized protein n=1 Tax=Rhodococcus tukisamuensis TaxID=168276 RepID=A0A1G6SDN1_9NOCA|nr:hypothetical protein SAMN05444580_103104 [Rhodococcus tukisamuensis]